MERPEVTRILETALYVADVAASREFYVRIFGFPVVTEDARLCALKVGEQQVLLLFRKGASVNPQSLYGGRLPGHDASGHQHFAFAVDEGSLPDWEAWFAECGVEVTGRVNWPGGSASLYFADPDGHLGEVVTPGLWGIDW